MSVPKRKLPGMKQKGSGEPGMEIPENRIKTIFLTQFSFGRLYRVQMIITGYAK